MRGRVIEVVLEKVRPGLWVCEWVGVTGESGDGEDVNPSNFVFRSQVERESWGVRGENLNND